MTWITWALISLAQEDLVARLASSDPEVRAAAEAGLKALETKRLDDLIAIRERTEDVEVRARLDGILRHLQRRKSGELYEQADVPGALKALANAEGEDRTAQAVAKFRELLPERSEDFSAGGNSLTGGAAADLLPKLEPLLPWIYPELVRRLGGRAELSGNASTILRQMGTRAAPALCWALRSASPAAQVQACLLLEKHVTASSLVLETLKVATQAGNADVRRHAEQALRRLELLK